MSRQNIDFATPGGHKVVLKEWLTRTEARDIELSVVRGKNFTFDAEGKVQEGVAGDTAAETMEQAIIEGIVVSIDGDTKVWEAYGKLRNRDALAVRAKAESIQNDLDDKKKEN